MVHHGLYIVGQVPTGARAQESERGTELWATRDFSFHAVILSVPSDYPDSSPGFHYLLDGVEVSSCPGQYENIVPFPQGAGSHHYIFSAATGNSNSNNRCFLSPFSF